MDFDVSRYHIRWTSQSENSAQSMPCGGCDTGANVWMENDELLLYLAKSGSFDENNQMLKSGRLRFSFDPPVFHSHFTQTLELERGRCVLTGDGARAEIWFDVHDSACHVELRGERPFAVTAQYECWRLHPRELEKPERTAAASYVAYPGSVTSWPDEVRAEDGAVLWMHRNRSDALLFDFLTQRQGLESVKAEMDNPQINLTFGGLLSGNNCRYDGKICGEYADVPFEGYRLVSVPQTKHTFIATLHTAQAASAKEWEAVLREHHTRQWEQAESIGAEALRWWKDFWQRSHIAINPQKNETDEGWRIGRNYTLFRYLLGCNAYGAYPTKFNGGLFTVDPQFSAPWDKRGRTPDFRAWGGGSFTAQNQRLVYWGMLRSGDFDMMKPQFEFYRRGLKNAVLRTKAYWGHGGCSFTEQLENMGLPIGWAWGDPDTDDIYHLRLPHFDPTEVRTPWLTYYYSSQLEFSYMILRYYRYTCADIADYIPFLTESVRFYFAHYEMLHFERCREIYRNGKLVIAPSTALESYKGAVNPMDAVAGLRAVLEELSRLPEYVDTEYYRRLLKRIPELPETERNGKRTLAPAEFWLSQMGDELPQLYPVFPYDFYHVGSRDLEPALNAWQEATEQERSHISWRQGGIFTARLGLTEEARRYCVLKLDDGPLRFPAFWGPGYDWIPDCNWGGSGMIGLQEMLVQEDGDRVLLLPAWPQDWDVSFRLHLSGGRVVEAEYAQGKLSWRIEGNAQKGSDKT